MCHRRFHGVFSVLLVFVSLVLGGLAIGLSSGLWLVVYLSALGLCIPAILYAYCAKCEARHGACAHVLPGKLTKLLPSRKQGPYSSVDVGTVVVFLMITLLFPQYWLVDFPIVMVVFWVLIVTAITEIVLCVCRGCPNKACGMRRAGKPQ